MSEHPQEAMTPREYMAQQAIRILVEMQERRSNHDKDLIENVIEMVKSHYIWRQE